MKKLALVMGGTPGFVAEIIDHIPMGRLDDSGGGCTCRRLFSF